MNDELEQQFIDKLSGTITFNTVNEFELFMGRLYINDSFKSFQYKKAFIYPTIKLNNNDIVIKEIGFDSRLHANNTACEYTRFHYTSVIDNRHSFRLEQAFPLIVINYTFIRHVDEVTSELKQIQVGNKTVYKYFNW